MKAATVAEIKNELANRSPKELLALCLRLSTFKKENKELLTYLLFEARDEEAYINSVKESIDQQFREINKNNIFFIKKSVRKILRNTNKFIRYSRKKQTEVELLIHYCRRLRNYNNVLNRSTALSNLYQRQLQKIRKTISTLHEDLQFDYSEELRELV